MKIIGLGLGLGLLSLSETVHALEAPASLGAFSSIKSPPMGVRIPAFNWSLSAESGYFENSGRVGSRVQDLNRSFTIGQLVQAPVRAPTLQPESHVGQPKSDPMSNSMSNEDKLQLTEYSNRFGSGSSMVLGTPQVQIEERVQRNTIQLAWGFTDSWSVGAVVPIVKKQLNVVSSVTKTDEAIKFLKSVAAEDSAKARELAAQIENYTNVSLQAQGYEALENKTVQGLGDITVNSRLMLEGQDPSLLVSLDLGVTLPTGSGSGLGSRVGSQYIDLSLGDSQWDLSAGLNTDSKLWKDLHLGFGTSYRVQLPDFVQVSIPVSGPVSATRVRENLLRDLGDVAEFRSRLTYDFTDFGLTIGAGYQFQYQLATRFDDGVLAPSASYRELEARVPLQSLQTASIEADFSTIDWFRQKKFIYPFQLGAVYTFALSGRNVVKADSFSGNMTFYF